MSTHEAVANVAGDWVGVRWKEDPSVGVHAAMPLLEKTISEATRLLEKKKCRHETVGFCAYCKECGD